MPADLFGRLDIKLLETSPGDKGWDIFSLDYRVDLPISTILNQTNMQKYLKIFNFLWRVKRVEQVFLSQIKSENQLHHLRSMSQHRLKFNLMRHEMYHFVSNLYNYIMLEAIESAWKHFKDQIAVAEDLNYIIETHDKFVEEVLDKALLKSDQIYRQMLKIFDLIFRFKYVDDILVTDLMESIERKKMLQNNE